MVSLKDKTEESQLNTQNGLSDGGHILYIYEDVTKYIKNAINYIVEGIENNDQVIFVDSDEKIEMVLGGLREKEVSKAALTYLTLVNADDFYHTYSDTGAPDLEVLEVFTEPHLKKSRSIRTWGHVTPKDIEKLLDYEYDSDAYINKYQIYSVCAYDGKNISASFMMKMLSVHEYLMTDESIVPSNLYQKQTSSSPSIVEQINLEKKEANIRLRSEQLTFAGQFAAGICHEIRNPLTTIKGFFQLMKEESTNDKFNQVIEQELERIQQITSELLLLAKPNSEQRDKHNLIDIIQDVKILLDSQAVMKSIQIKTIFEYDSLIIDCDDTKVKQVIINIVKNAIEVMENGDITIRLTKKNNFAVMSIKDQGPGIAKEVMNKIGQPFFTTKKDGTGLGLIISFNIIKSHGGNISIQSEEGIGTTFNIVLPLMES
ncbi:two-component sensor histidine kinase [Aquibacillus albus]|uniref:histidine kinase n=2 Tax=Aquibacillus albus TaxID=1168171 RepID=A0ABS2N103_9BACI|nr:two-component sensor histidine kinase [Aquibacillus albus]